MTTITNQELVGFEQYLIQEEKAAVTIEKYLRDVSVFVRWLSHRPPERAELLAYKAKLLKKYAPASVNSILASLNSFFKFLGRHELRVKSLKIQSQIFASEDKELTMDEYRRLLATAKDLRDRRLYLLMQTICATGIRVSEVQYISVVAVSRGVAEITGKGKRRRVFLPRQLCHMLRQYIKERKIKSGAVFVTRSGKPLDRSNIWSDMKRLCRAARVSDKKVFPHNLRHLFARTYYKQQKDIARLADILGHSNINTTRIYTKESGEIHRMQIQRLGLLL